MFTNSEELKKVLGGFFQELVQIESIKNSLIRNGLVVRFDYDDPVLSITIDSRNNEIKFLFDSTLPAPDVEMKMKANVAHNFWLGRINLPIALARRQIIAKGQIPKILKLLPVVKPAYKLYPEYLKKHGYNPL